MAETKISWADFTFNPWMGCTKVSEGCKHCYAETLVTRRMGLPLWGDAALRQLTKAPWKNVRDWQRQAAVGNKPGALGRINGKTPYLVFTGSLMDWAEGRDDLDPYRARMWDVIHASPDLIFQMLTKRPENISRYLPADWGRGYENVWLGTTIEDGRVKQRADHLRAVPAHRRFISYEPAIGPMNEVPFAGIHWVICGGESGAGFRALDMQWARDVQRRCAEEGIAFFMKQGSAYRTETDPFLVEEDGSRWAWKQFPVTGHMKSPVRM